MAVEWKKLNDVCSVHTGTQLNKEKMLEDGVYPVINGGQTSSGYTNAVNEKANSITISQGGESAGFVNWIDTDFWAGAHCYVLCDYNIDKRYLFHFLKSREKQIRSKRQGAGIPGLNRKSLMSLNIPVPSTSQQMILASKLDTFTSLVSKLNGEIELRKKQFEHYRDTLLDFEGREGVEMKTLGEIGTFIRGTGILKSDFVETGMPCIHYGQIHTKYGLSAKETISYIDERLYSKSKKAVMGDVVLATTSEDAEGCAKPVAWLGKEDVAVSGDAFIYHHNQNGEFMAHQFVTNRFLNFKLKNVTGAKVVRISGESMAKYIIPLPPLSEQQRIVSKLDTFSNLISKLEEERDLHQKQYEYYREKLLTFE